MVWQRVPRDVEGQTGWGGGPRAETLMSFRRTQAQARRLFTRKKRESWTKYVSKLNTSTPIKHVWDRVRKISGKKVCPPKQYLNRNDGASITDPKSIANEHAAAFADNSSSAHYSARFQAIKEQDEKVPMDFTSDSTEFYNKPFRLRDLLEDTLKILKDILNDIWTKGDFPHQWRAATVIPIPKPNKDHADPNSYRPIALTSCLCKILEQVTDQSR